LRCSTSSSRRASSFATRPPRRAPRSPPSYTTKNYKTPSAELAGSVAKALGLPKDYFPEFREAFVIDKVKSDPRLRERRLPFRGAIHRTVQPLTGA
jgi:hypothetical protein